MRPPHQEANLAGPAPAPGPRQPLQVHSAAATDVGHRRANNEDHYLAAGSMGLWAVADGMGGHNGGEVAAKLALSSLRRLVRAAPLAKRARENHPAYRLRLVGCLRQLVREVARLVHQRALADPGLHGMGCTLTAAVVRGGWLFLAHVGDSRAYLLREGQLSQLTQDHAVGHSLTRAVGPWPSVEADTLAHELHAGDTVLLCTDGLHGEVADPQLRRLLALPLEQAAAALVQAALDAGGRDNVTTVVLAAT